MLINERFKSPNKEFEKVYAIFDKRDYFNNKGLAKTQIGNFKRALEKNDSNYEELYDVLKGNTSIMFTDAANAPAKVIKEFRKKHDKPVFKAAHLDASFYIGEEYLDTLSELKSKNELIAEIVALLQSPAKNVISSLQSGGSKLSGIVKTLAERAE